MPEGAPNREPGAGGSPESGASPGSGSDPTYVGKQGRPEMGIDAPLTERFGPYRLLGELGRGGMSIVYEAEHDQRRRREALKVLQPALGTDPRLAERFHREVRAMAGLRHDHVVTVFDSGEVDGRLYYTMPVLPGPTLTALLAEIRATGETTPGAKANEVLDRHRFPPSPVPGEPPGVQYARRIAGALVGVADALAEMHDQDLLHRDVKPSNLMRDDRGRVQVADFGLVRTQDQRITATAESIGTPSYMSPEHITGGDAPLDGRADVYSLGATLYELLALRLPHQGKTIAETLDRILHKRVQPLREVNPALPRSIETIVGRCLEPRVQDRYPDAGRVRDDLAAFSRGEEIHTRPLGWPRRLARAVRGHWMPLAAAATVAAAALAWYFTRPAYLTVQTVPVGVLSIDGTEIGSTPIVKRKVPPGPHRVRVTRNGPFEPREATVSFERGRTNDLAWVLIPKDPADPEVVRLFAEARGYESTEPVLVATRSVPPRRTLVPVWPRGRIREAPRELVLWADDWEVELEVILIEGADPEAPLLARWPAPDVADEVRLPVEEAVRARMAAGTPYRVVVRERGGSVLEEATFSMLSKEETDRIDAEVNAATAPFAADDPSGLFVRLEALLSNELQVEAYAIAAELLDRLGPRLEVARKGLAILERAGLWSVGPWRTWARMYAHARRTEGG